jgi:WD40 repeat protein
VRILLAVFAVLSVAVSCDKSIEPGLWVANTPFATMELGGVVTTVDVTSDGEYLVTGHYHPLPLPKLSNVSYDDGVHVWSLPDRAHQHSMGNRYGWPLAVTHDGESLLVYSGREMLDSTTFGDFTFSLLQLPQGESVRRFVGVDWLIASFALTSDDKRVVASPTNGYMGMWNIESGEYVFKLDGTHAYSMAATPDGTHLIANTGQGVVVFSLSDGQRIKEFQNWGNAVGGSVRELSPLVLSKDGKYAFAAHSSPTMLAELNLQTGETGHVFRGHSDAITSLAVTSDDKYLVSGSVDGTIRIWSLESGTAVRTIRMPGQAGVLSLAITPDGQTIVCGTDDGNVYFWAVIPR